MDDVAQEALGALSTWLASVLPPASVGETLELLVVPRAVSPTGIGAHVGMNATPYGEVVGRRVTASAEVAISADETAINAAVSAVLGALLSQDRAALRSNGVYKLALKDLGPASLSGQGNNVLATRNASFDVVFEYLREPDAPGGVIGDIPLELDISLGGSPVYLINGGFDADFLDDFDVIDDDQVTQFAPSDWQFNAAESRIEQLSRIRGGGLQPSVTKAGTSLVHKTSGQVPAVNDLIMKVRLESSSSDGIGLVFRWQDPDNFYYFLMSARHDYRLMGKKVDGVFAFLDTPALDDTQGFAVDTPTTLKLVAARTRFSVFIDGEPALSGEDASISAPGRVGFFCHGNNQAYFSQLKLIGFL